MRLIKENDLFELRVLSLVSSEDLRVLHILYQPFLGNLAVSIYQTLIYTQSLYEEGPSSHDFLFKQLGATSLEFANAIAKLEACELVRTFVEKTDEFTMYFYEIFAPKLAKDFFKDPIFSGLLNSYIGERRVQQISELFSSAKPYNLKDKEVTMSFGEVYNPDLNADAFNKFINSDHLGRNEVKRKAPFNLALFKDFLRKNYQIIADKALVNDDYKRIVSLTMVYSFNEETMAKQIADGYSADLPLGQRINYDYVTRNLKEIARYKHIAKPKKLLPLNMLSNDSEKARLINRMEVEASLDFLASFNKEAVVPDSEISLLLRLSSDHNLRNGVINALVYYVLNTKDMQLPTAYVEKIAATLSRSKIEYAVDAINYLEAPKDARKPTAKTKVTPTKTVAANDQASEELDDDEYKKLLKELSNVQG